MVIKLQIKRGFSCSASYPQAFLLVSAKRVTPMAKIHEGDPFRSKYKLVT